MRKTLIKSIGIIAFIVVLVIGIVIVKQYNTKDITEQDDNSLINAFESTYCVSVDRDVNGDDFWNLCDIVKARVSEIECSVYLELEHSGQNDMQVKLTLEYNDELPLNPDVFAELLLQKGDFRVVTGYKTKEEKIWLTNDCIRAADTMIGVTEQIEYSLNLRLKQNGKEQYEKMMQYLEQSPGDIYVLLDGVVVEQINYTSELQATAEQLDFYSYNISADTKEMLYRTYFAVMTESMDYEVE